MFFYALFGLVSSIKGDNFNNRTLQDDPGYKRVMRARQELHGIFHTNRRPYRPSRQAATKYCLALVTLAIIVGVALYYLECVAVPAIQW